MIRFIDVSVSAVFDLRCSGAETVLETGTPNMIMVGEFVDDNYAVVARGLRVVPHAIVPTPFRLHVAAEDGDITPLQVVQGRCVTIRRLGATQR
jgi:hypothetical protein